MIKNLAKSPPGWFLSEALYCMLQIDSVAKKKRAGLGLKMIKALKATRVARV